MCPITIVIADDHPVVRVGLRAVLKNEDGFCVVGEASDGPEAVRIAQRDKPDVLVLDLMMPGMSGIQATSEVKRHSPHTRVIILSMHAVEHYVREAFQRGADGYVVKDTAGDDIAPAIRAVMTGCRYVSALVSDYAVEPRGPSLHKRDRDPYDALTARERELLQLIANGQNNRDIASALGIGIRTAGRHKANIMKKLHVRSREHLLHYALHRKPV